VQISMSHRITVSHCSIYDVPRAGINISEGTFGGHVIEYCDVFNTVLETGDHGSFNSWGRDRFWDPDIPIMNREVEKNPRLPYLDMLEPNTIRNSRWRCDHGWDIDLDDGSSQYLIYNNLLLNGGLKLREGYHRKVWNNIVVNNGLHPHVWPRNNGDVITLNIFFTSHKAIAMNRGMEEDEKWGKEIDYNIFTSSHMDRLLYVRNGCDTHSIVVDPGFRDPGSGNFSVELEGPVTAMGFRNFDMYSFGVLNPQLRALVKTPNIPELKMETDTARSQLQAQEVSLWEDAQLTEPRGEALSAYGVSLDQKGVAMAYVPEFSTAWEKGFRTGDLVLEVDGMKINSLDEFKSIMAKKGKYRVTLVRNQRKEEIRIN
ncbi:MAG: PDZ domain-containing protein, partial [Bacteroidota bacterium]|nr:PDZ domain-containing protein [Bacteroidota bacterium]